MKNLDYPIKSKHKETLKGKEKKVDRFTLWDSMNKIMVSFHGFFWPHIPQF